MIMIKYLSSEKDQCKFTDLYSAGNRTCKSRNRKIKSGL